MKYFKSIFVALFLVLSSMGPCCASLEVLVKTQVQYVDSPWHTVLEYAQENLSLEGELRISSDGFCYIKVDDNYIHSLFPLLGLEEEGFKKPPYFRTPEAAGAHVSVFYVSEKIIPDEVGEYFSFSLKQIVVVKTSYDTSYAVLQVESPKLEQLRKKYGLSSKLFGHEYHISLAKKVIKK